MKKVNKVNKVKLCRFHIHSFTFEDIVLLDKNNLYHVCDEGYTYYDNGA